MYSTNPDYNFQEEDQELETIEPSEQSLRVMLDKKQRKGKVVTLVTGFIGSEDDLKNLGKSLKSRCGTGGSVKEGEIIIQGDFKTKIGDVLTQLGYRFKYSGG